MNILLINTYSYNIEFGYFENDKLIFEKKLINEGNADLLTYYLYKSFSEHRKNIKNVEAVSLVNGPGSFTGLRVGSAIAKAICVATNSLLYEINTLDLICNKYKDKVDSEMSVIPLVPANTREYEFYYAEYSIENHKINRISEYKADKFEEINKKDSIYLINENTDYNLPKQISLVNLNNYSNIKSQFELTNEKILKKEETDYRLSEPFYIKKFIPIKK